MMEQPNFEQLRNLVARDELSIVIEQLSAAGAVSDRYRNAVFQLTTRFRDLRQELIAGTQSTETTTLTKNRLNRATLELLDAMERGESWSFDEDTPDSSPGIPGKNIVGGNVNHGAGDFRAGDNQGE